LAEFELYAEDHHWGDQPIDVSAHDLPALKVSYIINALPNRGRVLEIGCGGGRILKTIAIARPELDLHGYDIRPLAVDVPQFSFHLGQPDQAALPFEAGSFDAVVMTDILEHLTDPAAMLRAAAGVLAPTGSLISFVPLEGQRLSFYRFYRWILGRQLYAETKEHVQSFSEADLRRLVEERFTVVDAEYVYHLLGHFMDATLFALMKHPAMRRRFWEENPYYEETTHAPGATTGLFGRLLRVANAAAYHESRSLRHVRFGSAGLLFRAQLRR